MQGVCSPAQWLAAALPKLPKLTLPFSCCAGVWLPPCRGRLRSSKEVRSFKPFIFPRYTAMTDAKVALLMCDLALRSSQSQPAQHRRSTSVAALICLGIAASAGSKLLRSRCEAQQPMIQAQSLCLRLCPNCLGQRSKPDRLSSPAEAGSQAGRGFGKVQRRSKLLLPALPLKLCHWQSWMLQRGRTSSLFILHLCQSA